MGWLPDDLVHPVHVPLPGGAYHLRPIRESDAVLGYPAVMGSRERLWSIFGPAWGWPFRQPRYIGHDISWSDWLALPRQAGSLKQP
jgi:hypothetical protein